MPQVITLETASDRFGFDAESGQLVSMVRKDTDDVELIASVPDHPVFVIQYLSETREYLYVDSLSSQDVSVEREESGDGQALTIASSGVGGMDLDVSLTVRASRKDPLSRWSCTVHNRAGIQIVDVQFPFVVVPLDGSVVLPAGHAGSLIAGAGQPADEPRQWQIRPENGNSPHYPGRVFAQFLAWYAGRAGVYLACEDTEGRVKLIKPLRREPGVRLGIAHVGEWPTSGERTLEYEVALGSFTGDWYAAADLYRSWSLRQKWATPLTTRTDIPQWLLDSPPHITIRLQGYVDAGPAPAIKEFLPYEKCIPLLEGVAQRIESPLVAVLMSWERGGPWVYPDCFPPVGGDESMAQFVSMARARGWHVGSFCNGTRWVMKHRYSDYDGSDYFEQHCGEQGVCRRHDGELWAEGWDATWRPSYLCCMKQDLTKQIAVDFVKRLVGWGMESIQFFDQNCNARTFPCFAADHGHPPLPGRWMTQAMEDIVEAYRQVAVEAGEADVIQSTECACNEYCLPLFQQSDVRVSPPCSGEAGFIPLYHYLFHECTILHGMMSTGGEPYALPIRNAWNGVWGEIPGAVLTGDGTLLNRETFNWADWEPKVGSNDDSLEMIRTVTAMRQGPGRGFLVYGRMQRPAQVETDTVVWDHDDRHYEVPAVAHGAWQDPGDRHGVVLANWTDCERPVTVLDNRLGDVVSVHTCGRDTTCARTSSNRDGLSLTIPALGCVLVTAER